MTPSVRQAAVRRVIRIDPAILGLIILALVLAFHRLGAKSLVLDEATSIDHATVGLRQLLGIVSGGDPNMGLYYVLLHGWVKVFGDSDVAVRSLTVVVAGSSVAVVAALGGRLFGRMAGLAAGILLALNAFFLQYAQTARSYELVVLLVALSSYFFVVELEQPSRANRIGYVLASSLSIYAHYFSAFVLLVQLLTLIAVKRREAVAKKWVRVWLAISVLCLPEVVFAVRAGTAGIAWITRPSLHDLLDLPAQLAGGQLPTQLEGGTLLCLALIGLGCYGLLSALREGRLWPAGFVAAWLALPVLLAFALSFIQPMFISYYLIVSLPALVVLAGAGLVRLPGRVPAAVVLGALLVVSAGSVSRWYAHHSEEDYRGVARYILRTMRPGDGVIYFPSYTADPIALYERRAGATGPTPIALRGDGSLPAHPPRIWLVMRQSDTSPQQQNRLEQDLAAAYDPVSEQPTFYRVTVILYTARQA